MRVSFKNFPTVGPEPLNLKRLRILAITFYIVCPRVPVYQQIQASAPKKLLPTL